MDALDLERALDSGAARAGLAPSRTEVVALDRAAREVR